MINFKCPKEGGNIIPTTTEDCESMGFGQGCKYLIDCVEYHNVKNKILTPDVKTEVFDANI